MSLYVGRLTPGQWRELLEQLIAERAARQIFESLLSRGSPLHKLFFESNPGARDDRAFAVFERLGGKPQEVQTSAQRCARIEIVWPVGGQSPPAQLSPREGHCPAVPGDVVSGAKRLKD